MRESRISNQSTPCMNAFPAKSSVASLLMPMITGHMMARAIHAATAVGLMEELAEPRHVRDLATATRTHPDALLRLLRALTAGGLANEIERDTFMATSLAEPLMPDASPSLRNLVLMFGAERSWRSWEHLVDSLRDGLPASRKLYGMTGFEYFAEHPEAAGVFHAAMAEASHQVANALVVHVDWTRYRFIADIGGSDGLVLARILASSPGSQGLLFDLPEGLAGAPERLRAAGVEQRCEIVAGDFFKSVPAGADVYLMKNILHDWDDAACRDILGAFRQSAGPGACLMLVERVRPERGLCDPVHRQTSMMDLNMLVTTGGRERSLAEFDVLLEAAGLALDGAARPLPGTSHFSIIHAKVKAS